MTDALLLSGNEAIARGAYESGVLLGTGYPGTPSTEILETLDAQTDIQVQWAPNEKVALEVALGASFAGARALVTMKHVGLNVAADPLMTSAYIGAKGGLVIVTADDPGMHSSQNEQDNRRYAQFAKLPMLEPGDSQEAKDFTIEAFEISERFELPVLLRLTTRVCHSKSLTRCKEPVGRNRTLHFDRDPRRFVMLPAYARKRHALLEQKLRELRAFSETTVLNRVEWGRGDRRLGIVCSGVVYHYVREVFPDAAVLKIGLSYPLPVENIRKFGRKVRDLLIVEELEDWMLEAVLASGTAARGKPASFRLGELDPDRVKAIVEQTEDPAQLPPAEPAIPPRPPSMCPGCGHRGVYMVLKELDAIVTGDIGCYTLGALPPLEAVDSCVCMGASIGTGLGLRRVLPPEEARRVVSVIGDSTFFHSGLTGVLDAAYNGGGGAILILDNRTTAMTGHQDHPGSGARLDGQPAPAADPADLCRAMNIGHVVSVDAYDVPSLRREIRRAMESECAAVVVCRSRCMLREREPASAPLRIDAALCVGCGRCMDLGCRAIHESADGTMEIDAALCAGCGLCAHACKSGAIAATEPVMVQAAGRKMKWRRSST